MGLTDEQIAALHQTTNVVLHPNDEPCEYCYRFVCPWDAGQKAERARIRQIIKGLPAGHEPNWISRTSLLAAIDGGDHA